MDLRLSGPRGRRLLAGAAVLAVLGGAGTWTATASDSGPGVQREDKVFDMPDATIDTSYFVAEDGAEDGADDRRPAVLIGHGFGGSKNDVRAQAEKLAQDGYAVLTWSARGFGESTGKIGLNDPDGEVADVSRLIDWLAERPEVRLDAKGDPRVGVTGASYGGAVSLLAAGHDDRVDAIAPMITYWNLADALFPGDVYKKLWAGIFFNTGSADPAEGGMTNSGCGRFKPELCEMYERVAESGEPDDEARELLTERSPSAVGDRIDVPTLIVQGQSDSLFPLDQAEAMAEAIAEAGGPVVMDWIAGGHDGGPMETERVEQRVGTWFDRYLKEEQVDIGPGFRISRTGGVDTTDGDAQLRGATAETYLGSDQDTRSIPLDGGKQTFRNPPGAGPPAISGVPGVGDLTQLNTLGGGVTMEFSGQHATFRSAPLEQSLRITGSPRVRLAVTADTDEAVLFGKVYDVGPDGSRRLPHQLVSPVRVTGAERGETVELRLPTIDHAVEAGHRLELVVSATDLGYASPTAPADYTVAVTSDGLRVPTAPQVTTEAVPLPWWVWGLPAGGALVAALLLLGVRLRRTSVAPPDPDLADVPLQITGLSKKYAGSDDQYAVRDLTFRVEQGQVLGLLGPNGAGKTTTLRMLMGLIAPDEGEARIFGHTVRAGAPVLSRVGAFVEGAGFLPHLTGRANLDLYWQATGRPAEDARMDEALEIAGLGDALDRAVRTYSQGMRQRLAIAQAMLGMPELLILDEPTNGLDPPQIREMRKVMIRYAEGGRTVIVSSHLLAEVEQTCTDLVVMDRGRLVQAGPVAQITGSGDSLLVGVPGGVEPAALEKVDALPGVAAAEPADGGLLVSLDGMEPAELLAELVRLGVPVDRFGPHRRLEDAFLTLIGGESA
ncbi:alpha/beta fold hydrolase [Streptomyces sparsus]